MKTEIYTWRLSADLKVSLEQEAQRLKTSVSAILDSAAQDWLAKTASAADNGELQRRLHRSASRFLGAFAGNDAHRAERAARSVRARLKHRHDRDRSH